MKSKLIVTVFGCFLIWAVPVIAQEAARTPLNVDNKSSLPLRVLTRPMSNLYQTPNEESPVIKGNLPAFQSYFVYARPKSEDLASDQGWYEVGLGDRGQVAGWLKTDDVFEWRQTMCLAYTNPNGRQPVLMFEASKNLESMIKLAPEARTAEAATYYDTIQSGDIPKDFPVISVEPRLSVDITKQFYFLPILDFKLIELDGYESRLLKLAAVSGQGENARVKSDIRSNKDYLAAATATTEEAIAKTSGNLNVDVVWVIDTTRSMGPYIEQTLKVVKDVSEKLVANPEVNERLRFGVWGYRDPVDEIKGIEYTTKNFTPQLEAGTDFVKTMGEVKETKIDSIDFPEDMFSGLSDAITQTAWRDDALKIIILVGDAPGHELGHKWNLSGYDAEKLRLVSNERKITVLSLQVRPKGAKKYQKLAEDQFRELSRNQGAGKELYYDVDGTDISSFTRATDLTVETLATLVQDFKKKAASAESGAASAGAASGGTVAADSARPDAAPAPGGELAALNDDEGDTPTAKRAPSELDALNEDESTGEKAKVDVIKEGDALTGSEKASKTSSFAPLMAAAQFSEKEKELSDNLNSSLQAAMVDWLGSQTGVEAPREVVAWAVDKDLTDTSQASLEVRLLINKRQLDSLATLLGDVIKAGRTSTLSGDDFFTALQAASAVASRDPDLLKKASSIASSGLVPEFMEGLPYRSRFMDMNNDLWGSLSPDEQDAFINGLEANIKAYKTIHDDPKGWISLNQGDDPDETVYPIPLELLP